MNIKKYFTKQKPKTFHEVRSFLESVPYINYGGCGISALAMYDAAVKEKLKSKIVFCYDFFSRKSENDKFKKGDYPHGESCAHVLVKVMGKYWDSDGTNEHPEHYMWADEAITREHLLSSIHHGNWNSRFDRKTWVPKIEKFIGYKLLGAE